MRLGRTRLALACVIGSAMVGLTAPAAWATSDTVTTNETPAAAATPTATAPATPLAVDTPSATESAPATPPAVMPSVSAIPSIPVPPIPTTLPSGVSTDMIKELLDLVPGLPIDLPTDLTDLKDQPLVLSYTCGPNGPSWKIKNTSSKALGFGWFDTDIKGDIGQIGAGQTLPLKSSAIAVLATPFDAETGELIMAIPAIGVAMCPGADHHATPTPTAATQGSGSTGGSGTVAVATPAKAIVTDNVHFTG